MPRKTRQTKQKEIIQSELDKINTFFSADDLFSRVKEINPEIGIATVYRFLRDLKKKNKAYSYICDRRALYSKEQKSHCHFVCEKTGKVIHFDIDSLDFLKNKIPGSIVTFQLEIRGICGECDEKK